MAEWQQGGDLLLIENHGPLCAAAATACQGFCRSELDVFRAALGGASVEREEHIVGGDRIRPAAVNGRRKSG